MNRLEEKYKVQVIFSSKETAMIAYVKDLKKGIIVVQEKYKNSYILKDVIKHEIGHILDYRDRGAFWFFFSAIVSYPGKIKAYKMKGKERIIQYHNTGIERYANRYFGLSYKNFCS